MAINKKQINEFDLNSNPANDVSIPIQTTDGTTQRTTKSALLNDVNASLIGLQTQIETISGIGDSDIRGIENCVVDQQIYTITYGIPILNPSPIVSLTLPTSSSTLFVQGVVDITNDDFKVILSGPPSEEGYKINWSVKAPVSATGSSFLELTDTPFSYTGNDGFLVAVSGSDLVFQHPSTFTTDIQNDIDLINTSILGISGGIIQIDNLIDTKIEESVLKALEKQIDDHSSDSTITYVGEANPGSDTSSAVWRIKRIVEDSTSISIEWADGNGDFDNVYDDREGLSYS